MTPFHASESERAVRASLRKGDAPAAARAALELHGPEVYGFLCGVLSDRDVAERLYADVVQRVTTEIENLRWRRSLRPWMYWIARRELQDRRCRLPAPLPHPSAHAEPEVTESNRPIGTVLLRNLLEEEDRELLILRVDRGLGWSDLAVTGLGEDAPVTAIARESLRLRARLDRIVRQIHRGASGGAWRPPRDHPRPGA